MPAPVSEAAKHRSGDPELAVPKDEATMVPHFTDKYEERAYLKHRLAIAFRIFAQNGLSESVAGHITLKDPVDPTSFWVNPFGALTFTMKPLPACPNTAQACTSPSSETRIC